MILKWLPVASAASGEVVGGEGSIGGLLRQGCGWHIAVRNFLLKDQRYGQTRMFDTNMHNNGNEICIYVCVNADNIFFCRGHLTQSIL